MSKIKNEKQDGDNINNKRKKRRVSCRLAMTVLLVFFKFFRYYFDLLVDKIFGLYYDSKREYIKESTNTIILESATSLARKICRKELKVIEVVHAFIERIKEVNPVINAVVDNQFNQALKEAKEFDIDIASGVINDADFRNKPFLGVPFTAKESTAVKGMSHTFGLVKRKSRKADYDAAIVEHMKKAGAICLGVTNIPQLNLWQETSNPLFGLTKNPYNTTRNVGGSSGGEASILAASGTPIALGTDIGGSSRIPAFMCGVFGHKPSSHLISTAGLTFRTGNEKDTMVVAGPMTRHAEDLIPLMKVLVAENLNKLKLDEPVDVKSIKVFYIEDPNDPFVSPFREEMKSIFRKVVGHFAEISTQKPGELKLPGTRFAGKLWRYWMTQEEGANFKNDINNKEGEVNAATEIVKFFTLNKNFTGGTVFNLINGLLPKEKEEWARTETDKLKTELTEILGTNSILLYPSAPWPASYHHTAFLRPWNFNLFAIWNVLKFPVTQVPLGLSRDGLPLGIQVVAAPLQDHLCIAVAKELERRFGGYVPPYKTT